jgi:hypothetical protein
MAEASAERRLLARHGTDLPWRIASFRQLAEKLLNSWQSKSLPPAECRRQTAEDYPGGSRGAPQASATRRCKTFVIQVFRGSCRRHFVRELSIGVASEG